MLLNHAKRTPHEWDDAELSKCPDCDLPLIPRRGQVVAWHWAHKSAAITNGGPKCHTRETSWHLRWKMAYHTFRGWEIEYPVMCDGERFRADAMNPATGRIREFVHSLADSYARKHMAMRRAGLDVLWIFDGSEFVASRRGVVSRGGVRHLLKPRARWLHSIIGGFVHHEGRLWKQWRDDVWFPLEGETPNELLMRFESQCEQPHRNLFDMADDATTAPR